MCFVYILTNKRHTVLYVGSTNNLANRLNQHYSNRNKKSFTARYNLCKLVYFEPYKDMWIADGREKQIKGGSRKKKEDLIDSVNPSWNDLSDESLSYLAS